MQYSNHLKIGNELVLHKGKNVATSLNSIDVEELVKNFNSLEFRTVTIESFLERRADLISNYYYNTPLLDWLICWFNNIKDPFQDLYSGRSINIPNIP